MSVNIVLLLPVVDPSFLTNDHLFYHSFGIEARFIVCCVACHRAVVDVSAH